MVLTGGSNHRAHRSAPKPIRGHQRRDQRPPEIDAIVVQGPEINLKPHATRCACRINRPRHRSPQSRINGRRFSGSIRSSATGLDMRTSRTRKKSKQHQTIRKFHHHISRLIFLASFLSCCSDRRERPQFDRLGLGAKRPPRRCLGSSRCRRRHLCLISYSD